jgi:hypothetical protein
LKHFPRQVKKGDIHEVKNNKPRPTFSVLSKILEKLMYNRLMHLLVKNIVFIATQNGFRKK